MSRSTRPPWIGYGLSLGGVVLVTLLYFLFVKSVNTSTVAFSYLLVVLVVASMYGLGPSIVASVAGMLCFNFFFLPPIGKFTIADPQNWVALFAFLITAMIASQLSSVAQARAQEAESGRDEVWKLYQLSRALMATPDSETAISSSARQVVEIFGIPYCAVWTVGEDGTWQRLAMATELNQPEAFVPDPTLMQTAFDTGELLQVRTPMDGGGKPAFNKMEKAASVTYTPLKVGVRSVGVLILMAAPLAQGTVEAVAGLVAWALERARFLQAMSRTEALRQSDELKSALLASVSHNLRTPLTAIRVAIDNLLQEDLMWDPAALREFHLIISEETYRLTRLVQNLLEMARIEAGELHLAKQWSFVSEIFRNALDRCAAVLRDHPVTVELPAELSPVQVDSRLVGEVLTHLIENAAKYSPSGSQITLSGLITEDELLISVKDQGPGMGPEELQHIFDKFYRGKQLPNQGSEGTGMGLAIARGIVQAHGGRIWAESRLGHGATFRFSLPMGSKDATQPIAVDTEL